MRGWRLEVRRFEVAQVGGWFLHPRVLASSDYLYFVFFATACTSSMHPQQVAAPQFGDLRFGVAAPHEFQRDVERLVGAVPAVHAAAAVEVRRDADVVDADQLHGVVDVIDEVLDRRARRRRELRVDRVELLLQIRALFLAQRGERVAATAAAASGCRAGCAPRAAWAVRVACARAVAPLRHVPARHGRRRARRRRVRRPPRAACPPAGRTPCAARRARRRAPANRRLHVAGERHGLHHAAVLLQRQQLLVVQVAADVGQLAHRRVRRDDRRLRQRQRLHHRLLRRMRDVDHDADAGSSRRSPACRAATGRSTSSPHARRCSSPTAGCGRCARATCSARRDRRTP